jgi:hypothetical protein
MRGWARMGRWDRRRQQSWGDSTRGRRCAPGVGGLARLQSGRLLIGLLPAASRWLWAGLSRANPVRVFENLGRADGGNTNSDG